MTATLERTRTSTDDGLGTYNIIVVELDDVVPRRRADRPNLLVRSTVEDPEAGVEQIRRGAKPSWAEGRVVRLRLDLMTGPAVESLAEAKRSVRTLVHSLEAEAYTVNRRNTPVWSTYVVQLDESRCDDPGNGWVYVGETSKSVDDRLAQYLAGRQGDPTNPSSRTVFKYGQRLRYGLMAGWPNLYSRAKSLAAEAAIAEELRSQGYRVEGRH